MKFRTLAIALAAAVGIAAPVSFPASASEVQDETQSLSFEALTQLSEEELQAYCTENQLPYLSKDAAVFDLTAGAIVHIYFQPDSYVLTESQYDFEKQYDWEKMEADLNLPDSGYTIYKYGMMGYVDDEDCLRNAAVIIVRVNPDASTSLIRLYQLIAIWCSSCDAYIENLVEYPGSGGINPADTVNTMVGVFQKGDVNLNGSVTVADVIALQKCLLCTSTMTEHQFFCADINQDSIADVQDLSWLRQWLVGE